MHILLSPAAYTNLFGSFLETNSPISLDLMTSHVWFLLLILLPRYLPESKSRLHIENEEILHRISHSSRDAATLGLTVVDVRI